MRFYADNPNDLDKFRGFVENNIESLSDYFDSLTKNLETLEKDSYWLRKSQFTFEIIPILEIWKDVKMMLNDGHTIGMIYNYLHNELRLQSSNLMNSTSPYENLIRYYTNQAYAKVLRHLVGHRIES